MLKCIKNHILTVEFHNHIFTVEFHIYMKCFSVCDVLIFYFITFFPTMLHSNLKCVKSYLLYYKNDPDSTVLSGLSLRIDRK